MEERNRCIVIYFVDECQQLGVSTPSILNWIRAHAATHAPRPQPEPGESVVVMELDELWHFLQKKEQAVDLAGF